MNTKEIQQLIAKQQVNKGHNLVCENLSNYFPAELDVLSVTAAGYAYEFEVKISRADYKKDSEKYLKHNLYKLKSEGMPNYFYYCCPKGLIKGHEIPAYAGLIYITDGFRGEQELQEIIKAPLLHKTKPDLLKLALKVARVTSERMYLGGCKLTVKNNQIKVRNNTILAEAGFSEEQIKSLFKRR